MQVFHHVHVEKIIMDLDLITAFHRRLSFFHIHRIVFYL